MKSTVDTMSIDRAKLMHYFFIAIYIFTQQIFFFAIPRRLLSKCLNSVHYFKQCAHIVFVDGERRIVRRNAPYQVGVIIVMIATLYHACIVCNNHIYIAMHYTLFSLHSFYTDNIAIIDIGLHRCT